MLLFVRILVVVLLVKKTCAIPLPKKFNQGLQRQEYSPPTEMTQVQKEVVQNATKNAESASKTANVAKLFDDQKVRNFMQENCPSIASMSSEALAQGIDNELRYAELVSNFEADGGGMDSFSLNDAQEDNYWPNSWEMIFLSNETSLNCSDYIVQQAAEENLYGFPPFSSTNNCIPPNFQAAANRPVYTAINSLRIDVGNPAFGDVSLVWRRSNFADVAGIVAHCDTGIWEFECDPVQAHPQDFWLDHPNCTQGPPGPFFGSLTHFSHLFQHSNNFFNDTNWLGLQTCRMLSTEDWGVEALVTASQTLEYWETVVAKTASLTPSRIRFVIASFASLFGHDEIGDRLRRICRRKGWILVWGFGDSLFAAAPDYDSSKTPKPFNRRLLDPITLDNTTLVHDTSSLPMNHAQEIQIFQKHWRIARDARPWSNASQWHDAFDALSSDLSITSHIAPLSARDDCPHPEDCIGTVPSPFSKENKRRYCLCYKTPSIIQ
uniref:ILEI/PANDER domain-containing protein n=1 Tax=Aureoumbra lagunensis TaxID=44058 RepID=A0A7S3JZZ1_9STRA|mmetsp:Transcript_22046/g.34035  ORF Transcript_22046/g.34035 Transcript_22046/m.34035 type:complete len:492 (+) Transcript_22046:47-1522(+)